MTVPADPIPAPIRAEIEARLHAIVAQDGVRLLLAAESGSRAWGFPSPDSDYDVRFLFVRPRDTYLSLRPPRDVIEQPIVDEIDLSGWDIRKALALLLKSNAVLGEWIASPIRYAADDPVIPALAALADAVQDPAGLARHYASVGRNAAARWLGEDGPVPAKKYFYALRPALAIRWLRQGHGPRPPMNLQRLVEETDLPAGLADAVAALVEIKMHLGEAGRMVRVAALETFIVAELAHADAVVGRAPPADALARADRLLIDLLG